MTKMLYLTAASVFHKHYFLYVFFVQNGFLYFASALHKSILLAELVMLCKIATDILEVSYILAVFFERKNSSTVNTLYYIIVTYFTRSKVHHPSYPHSYTRSLSR